MHSHVIRTSIALLALVTSALVTGCEDSPSAASDSRVRVCCAASAADAVAQAGAVFEAQFGIRVAVNSAATSTLVRQLQAGAGADLFLSANAQWMAQLQKDDRVGMKSRVDLLGNELVVVAPKGADVSIDELLKSASARLAIGDPAHVPAGMYAKQALESMDAWERVRDRVIPALDVRAALRLVERGEADFGVVYRTDARASTKVEVVTTIDDSLHEPIRYSIALLSDATAATEFFQFLQSPEARRIFEDAGFIVMAQEDDS